MGSLPAELPGTWLHPGQHTGELQCLRQGASSLRVELDLMVQCLPLLLETATEPADAYLQFLATLGVASKAAHQRFVFKGDVMAAEDCDDCPWEEAVCMSDLEADSLQQVRRQFSIWLSELELQL